MYLAGDTLGFDLLYARYRQRLYSFLNRLFPGRGDRADDVFQATWLKAIAKFSDYSHQEKFISWLFKIAHNSAIDHLRRERRIDGAVSADALAELPAADAAPWHELELADLGAVLTEALGQLSPEQRELVLLRQDGMSFQEIAQIQDCPLNTALGRARYALKNLRVFIQERGVS